MSLHSCLKISIASGAYKINFIVVHETLYFLPQQFLQSHLLRAIALYTHLWGPADATVLWWLLSGPIF